ncbi:MAG: NgoFVII family restriction endonuclease [Candidatus Magasanikbacteria bacterium]|nr:NgoFVII family restriction endonuclease [Candidatus Magasanikbacteria bacterium]
MFFNNQTKEQKQKYQDFLKIAGCLSNMFSDSEVPYLYYRVAEKVFCRAFNAEDLSRSDVSSDAKKDLLGIGLKTFLKGNDKTFQKIAEFNRDRPLYKGLEAKKLIEKVSKLRNARIEFTENVHGLNKSIYHCVLRDSGKFKIFEEPMEKVDIQNIHNIKINKGSIVFDDAKSEYSFLLSKSTLTKRFVTKSIIYEFDVDVLKDPLFELNKLFSHKGLLLETKKRIKQTIYLPLYSPKEKKVQEKSGINQWNAKGRIRHPNEVYILVPAEIHNNFPGFFPNKDTPFNLKFPDGDISESKICQQGGKALMTKSNRKLGKLILRDGLNLKEGELATYEKLQLLGIDSVRIDKISNSEFEINFSKIGSYEQFKNIFYAK